LEQNRFAACRRCALASGSTCITGAKCTCTDVGAPFQTCGDTCEPVFGCGCIDNDPARIRFGNPGQPDLFKIHGRFRIQSPMDPPADGFTIFLSNSTGIVYTATLQPGDLVGGKGRFEFTDPTAKHGAGASLLSRPRPRPSGCRCSPCSARCEQDRAASAAVRAGVLDR
jgi:hypothetical protein